MSKIKYIPKKIIDLCDIIPENHTFTKSYIKEHEGKYPVYSATVGIPFGYMSYYTQNEPMLVVVNYGNSGTIYYVDDKYFSLGRNACGIRIKKEYRDKILLQYVRYAAQAKLKQLAKGWNLKNLNQAMVKSAEINIPINCEGMFDLQRQLEMTQAYLQIEEQKKDLLAKVNELKNISVLLPKPISTLWAEVKITDLFNPKGGNMLYSKTWAKENPGVYPLYSGTTSGSYDLVNKADYNGEYLTWCIDGLAGYMMYHNEAFSLTCHRGILEPKENIEFANIDLKYIKYVLEPLFRKRKKGREGDLGKNEYTSLKPIAIKKMKDTIPIPIKEDRSFDLAKQKELASKYEQIDTIKNELIDKILKLTDIVIT